MTYAEFRASSCGAHQGDRHFRPPEMAADHAAYSVRPAPSAVGTFPQRMMFALTGELARYSAEVDREWSFRQPLTVTLERDEDGTYILSDDDFFVYGAGPDIAAALNEYLLALLDYFDLVTHSANPLDADQAARLRTYLAARTAA